VQLSKESKTHLFVAAAIAALGLLLAANIALEFDTVTTAPGQPLTRREGIKLIAEANYCDTASDCIWIHGGDWSAKECRWGDILVNASETHRMFRLCEAAAYPRQFFIRTDPMPGLDNPRCVERRCVPGQ